MQLYIDRGVARGGGGANRPGRRVEGAPMKPTISTKLLFNRIILVCFSKKALLIDVLAPPHWQKTDTIFQKYGNFESRWSPTTKNRPTKNLICLYIAKFWEKLKRFRKFWWIRKKFLGVGGAEEGGAGGEGRQTEVCAPGAKNPRYAPVYRLKCEDIYNTVSRSEGSDDQNLHQSK